MILWSIHSKFRRSSSFLFPVRPPFSLGIVLLRCKTRNGNVPLAEINIGLLADQVGVAATNTLDLGQGVHDVLLAVNIGVEQTQNVLEVRLLAGHERCSHVSPHIFPSPTITRYYLSENIRFMTCRTGRAQRTHDGRLARLARDAVVEMWQV